MAATKDLEFAARLQQCVDKDGGHETRSAHTVNQAMISLWADAMRDANPIYVDEQAAITAGRPGIVAPPTMIQAWIMPPLSGIARATPDCPGLAPYRQKIEAGVPTAPTSDDAPNVYAVLAERGFVNSAATNCRQVYHREYRPGDHVSCISTLDSVSAEKNTAMGKGHFLTTRLEYIDQNRVPIATQYWTILRYREKKQDADATVKDASSLRTMTLPDDMRQPEARPGADLQGAPQIGQVTQAGIFPITPSFVICTALATHDFYPIHHDVDWARSLGQPDIFSNILTTTALVGGVMTKWGGPRTILQSTDLRLFVPNFPGDTLVLQGEVTGVDGDGVTMVVNGINNLGTHVEAVVTAIVQVR